jgi:NADP-dependent 3-hydroxy acid dehydrogenase YdfG
VSCLAWKSALVTGTKGALGYAILDEPDANCAQVPGTSHNQDYVKIIASKYGAYPFALDVCNTNSLESNLNSLWETEVPIYLPSNNVAMNAPQPVLDVDVDVDEDSWRRVMDTRVNGTFLSHKHLSVIGSLRVSMKAWLMLVLRRASWLSRSELSTDQVRRTSRK